jgi:hypothetical protein
VIARRSVRGASLKAATFGLWSVDDFHRIAQGHHRDCSCRHSRSLHDHTAVALAPGGMVPRRTSGTNADSRAKPDSNLENHSMLASFAGIRVRGPCCEDTELAVRFWAPLLWTRDNRTPLRVMVGYVCWIGGRSIYADMLQIGNLRVFSCCQF